MYEYLDNNSLTCGENLKNQIYEVGRRNAFKENEIESVYFGGGTPTTLSCKNFKEILSALKNTFNLSKNCEVATKTTLHNLTDEHILLFNEMGINRISIGIQTFQTYGREFFNRIYNKEEMIVRLNHIKNLFLGCICIDKIYNYPKETEEMLLDDVEQIIQLK